MLHLKKAIYSLFYVKDIIDGNRGWIWSSAAFVAATAMIFPFL
jgi:hypothetical protein